MRQNIQNNIVVILLAVIAINTCIIAGVLAAPYLTGGYIAYQFLKANQALFKVSTPTPNECEKQGVPTELCNKQLFITFTPQVEKLEPFNFCTHTPQPGEDPSFYSRECNTRAPWPTVPPNP